MQTQQQWSFIFLLQYNSRSLSLNGISIIKADKRPTILRNSKVFMVMRRNFHVESLLFKTTIPYIKLATYIPVVGFLLTPIVYMCTNGNTVENPVIDTSILSSMATWAEGLWDFSVNYPQTSESPAYVYIINNEGALVHVDHIERIFSQFMNRNPFLSDNDTAILITQQLDEIRHLLLQGQGNTQQDALTAACCNLSLYIWQLKDFVTNCLPLN